MANVPSLEVQLLLAAEKRATEKVSDARKRKAHRLKRAKEEAAAEIEQFKAEKQIDFNRYEVDHIGTTDDTAKKIERDTNENLEAMEKRFKVTRDQVLKRLIEEVISGVSPKLHPNKRPTGLVA